MAIIIAVQQQCFHNSSNAFLRRGYMYISRRYISRYISRDISRDNYYIRRLVCISLKQASLTLYPERKKQRLYFRPSLSTILSRAKEKHFSVHFDMSTMHCRQSFNPKHNVKNLDFNTSHVEFP